MRLLPEQDVGGLSIGVRWAAIWHSSKIEKDLQI